VTKASNEELEGITLDVYLHVLKKGKPVGPREVMKAANLSSPSVAYRHLQKLEDLGYLQRNQYGEYIAKNKAHITGYVWIGHRLIPKMWRYSLVFVAILAVELIVLAIHYRVETDEFKIFFLLLILVTTVALGFFTREGLLQNRRKHYNKTIEDTQEKSKSAPIKFTSKQKNQSLIAFCSFLQST
jgi:hypothetical protein